MARPKMKRPGTTRVFAVVEVISSQWRVNREDRPTVADVASDLADALAEGVLNSNGMTMARVVEVALAVED